ncbi:general odorant-binding protein 67-like isoform X3 [Anopheles gambiae]|uniref:general odorant-binding protein 67-like isoform X3 n=2 Tax=Anopheles gambiae TaxID=7165 RepID=UPI002AC93C33|nr:general odorant-binding protein 67-like isoform X3 [Anopheles gambiae]
MLPCSLVVVAVIISCNLSVAVNDTRYSESSCLQRLVNYRECCSMPRLLPEQVIETCRARPLPTAIPGVPDPLPENCIAECALNETGILFNGQFRVEQAVKALSTQVPNDTLTWQHVIEVASKKCYIITVGDSFYLRDVAKNLISPQCIPSSFRFLQCTFSIVYRDCPDIYWNYQNDRCGQFVVALNNCHYLFRHIWDI